MYSTLSVPGTPSSYATSGNAATSSRTRPRFRYEYRTPRLVFGKISRSSPMMYSLEYDSLASGSMVSAPTPAATKWFVTSPASTPFGMGRVSSASK
jgi:hypothetical protein